jgi:Asp-tRNA(Asn)/Glu-tRNA(Gln) amidotransferase A subunit family amidase
MKEESQKKTKKWAVEKMDLDGHKLEQKKDFAYWTVKDYAYAFRKKLTTPTEVAKAFFAKVGELDKSAVKRSYHHIFTVQDPLRAFFSINEEDLREQAKESSSRFKKGEPISILDGVLVAVKDEVDVKGYPTKVGTVFLKNASPAKEDCTAGL